ncbi:MAG TPA: alpha/beta hydrolase [Steroidobacteraceae bacterium]|nr:alpha/beta hydrolase [Steroidobacteraceae bacterium]
MTFDLLEISRRIRALGTEIAPQSIEGTAAVYAPFHEREPYRAVSVLRDASYGPHERQRLDVFRAEAAPRAPGRPAPVLVFVHGGGFVAGDKRNPGSPYNDNIALWAVRHGLVGVNMTYRLAPQFPWPAGAEDVAAALSWVRRNIADHGGDPRRIFLMGTSAGAAHAASYVAHREFQSAGAAGIGGAILLSGMYDLTIAPRNPFQIAYYGNDDEQYRRASPLGGLLQTPVPLLFVLTEMDPPDFQRQGLTLLTAWVAHHGRWPNFVHMLGHNHLSSTMHLNTPDGFLGERLLDFIDRAAPV